MATRRPPNRPKGRRVRLTDPLYRSMIANPERRIPLWVDEDRLKEVAPV